MSIWELPKEPQFYKWESPITKIYGDIHNEIVRQDEENYMCTIKQAIGYEVNKEELIKALQYDRNQYDKGYNDGVKETFVTELEKIKAEIKEESYSIINIDGDFYDLGDRIVDIEDINEIIDKHISELKGKTE